MTMLQKVLILATNLDVLRPLMVQTKLFSGLYFSKTVLSMGVCVRVYVRVRAYTEKIS